MQFSDDSGNYLTQYYSNKSDLDSADPVAVSAGLTTSNINVTLALAGHIAGTVTLLDPTLPVGTTKVTPGQTGEQLKTTRLVTAADGTVLHNDTWISTWPMYPTTITLGIKL